MLWLPCFFVSPSLAVRGAHSNGGVYWYDFASSRLDGQVKTFASGLSSPAGINIGDANGASMAPVLLPPPSHCYCMVTVVRRVRVDGDTRIALALTLATRLHGQHPAHHALHTIILISGTER
jgi:hypothetical protein